MRKIYLLQLWKKDKKLALVLSLFIVGQAFFSYKQIETVPFFNYGMYARPITSSTYTHYQLYNDQQVPISLDQYPEAVFLAYQLPYYQQLQQQNPIDAPLKQTIQQRFGAYPFIQNYLIQQLTNKSSALPHAQQWLSKKTEQNKISTWKENYVWVKDNFVLLTKTLVL